MDWGQILVLINGNPYISDRSVIPWNNVKAAVENIILTFILESWHGIVEKVWIKFPFKFDDGQVTYTFRNTRIFKTI